MYYIYTLKRQLNTIHRTTVGACKIIESRIHWLMNESFTQNLGLDQEAKNKNYLKVKLAEKQLSKLQRDLEDIFVNLGLKIKRKG